MSNKKNDGRISPANWIAIIAMALLALFTFFGRLYSSGDGQMGMALLFTLLEVVLLTGAIMLAIKAKKQKSHIGMWRIVMYVSLVAYVVVAILFAAPLLKFFSVNAEKDHLKEIANEEIEAIEKLYDDYNTTMQDKTNEAVERLHQYMTDVKNGAAKSPSVEDLLKGWSIQTPEDLVGADGASSGWKKDVEDAWRLGEDQALKDYQSVVDNWSFFDLEIAQVAAGIDQKADDVVEFLNNKVKENAEEKNIIPVIEINEYKHAGFVKKTFERPDVGAFHDALSKVNTNSVIGWVLFIVLHLLILLNFAVTEGAETVFPGAKNKSKSSTGIDL